MVMGFMCHLTANTQDVQTPLPVRALLRLFWLYFKHTFTEHFLGVRCVPGLFL